MVSGARMLADSLSAPQAGPERPGSGRGYDRCAVRLACRSSSALASVSPLRRARLTALVAVLACVPTVPGAAREVSPTRHVLFLNSYQPGFNWSDDVLRGVQNVLSAQPYPVELWVEFLDTRRFGGDEYAARLDALLMVKHRGRRFDAIVASDDAALQYLLERQTEMFPDVPVVFCGINSPELAARASPDRFTGVREVFRIEDIVQLAVRLRPGTVRFVVVSDATETAAVQLAAYRQLAIERPDLQFTIFDGSTIALDEILEGLRRTPRDAAVLTTAFTLDRDGRYYPRDEALAALAEASPAPVYSTSISRLGQGILAGAESRGRPHGEHAGNMVVELLDGARPADIPRASDGKSRFVIDHARLARWGIDEARLPPTAILLNHPSSFYATNLYVIWAGAAFILLQAAVIGALIVNVSRRRRVERRLAEQARRLGASNEDLGRVNASLVREMKERQTAEDKLRHAQRLEAVGRLAGGVAHDFNNLLTVIGSYTELVLDQIRQEPARRQVEQIRRASGRAADLTRQLLAFSRKQMLRPAIEDLNVVVAGIVPMLRRLISENVRLETRRSTTAATALVDRGQMEQVIVNLAINARDAMPQGGDLTIETAITEITPGYRPDREGMPAGRYVRLTVTDTGHGMDDETRARAFEPFFTTKDVGHGTGLGLATVYGIVKQSGGWIWIDSGRERGTTFTVLLPLVPVSASADEDGHGAMSRSARPAPDVTSARETILLVEDQPDVRRLTASVLAGAGYTVIEAGSGEEALRRAAAHAGALDLIVTDVIMPGIGGRDVAEQLRASRSDLRVLYVSGYSDDILAQGGVLHTGTAFLAKPFTPEGLMRTIRSVLDT